MVTDCLRGGVTPSYDPGLATLTGTELTSDPDSGGQAWPCIDQPRIPPDSQPRSVTARGSQPVELLAIGLALLTSIYLQVTWESDAAFAETWNIFVSIYQKK